ncbi:hypothetical protein F183_A40300 [Bryobacterales bacterium F-183]|nr:hypothetical protein F183_A40300 [Bryobacterales bacterium F-183]
MIFLQGFARKEGPSGACLSAAEAGEFRLIICPSIIQEVASVLLRPELQRKFPSLNELSIARILRKLASFCDVVADPQPHIRLPRDPKDEPYLNLAIEANADYLVTWDRDLLDGVSEAINDVGETFRQLAPGVKVIDPLEFLTALRTRLPE